MKGRKESLICVILSHLSDKSKIKFNFLTISYQKPSFNYVSFCKYLDLYAVDRMVLNIIHKTSFWLLIREIMSLFNENAKFTHLYIPTKYKFLNISEVKTCFSELGFLQISTDIDDNALTGLIEIRKSVSIKVLDILVVRNSNNEIFKLIESFKLHDVRINYFYLNSPFNV